MGAAALPKIYRSFEEFERDELRKLDGLHVSIDDMLDEMFAELDSQLSLLGHISGCKPLGHATTASSITAAED